MLALARALACGEFGELGPDVTGYTALTIFLWILVGARNAIGYVDKFIEIALVALLVLEARRPRSR